MSKTLQVIEPFFTLAVGDLLELSEDGKNYVNVKTDEFNESDVNDEDFNSSYSSTVTFSLAYARELIKAGILEEVLTNRSTFVNIFDEIDNLLNRYTAELKTVGQTEKDMPECVKLEKTTVLHNMIKLLTHLKSLKK